jgi:hypothetical protein
MGPQSPQASRRPPPTPPEPTEPVSERESGHRDDDGPHVPESTRAARREAAAHRVRAREVEAERDRLAARIDRQDTAEVERMAAETMSDPTDLWMRSRLDAMRDDNGELDPERVRAEIERVLSERPHWAKREPVVNFHDGVRMPPEAMQRSPGFGDAIKRAVHGER